MQLHFKNACDFSSNSLKKELRTCNRFHSGRVAELQECKSRLFRLFVCIRVEKLVTHRINLLFLCVCVCLCVRESEREKECECVCVLTVGANLSG